MLFVFIAIMCLVQLLLYYLKPKLTSKLPDFIIMDALILCNLFVFPKIFCSILLPEEISCGLPVMGITFGFWIFGNIAVIIVHVLRKQYLRFIDDF